MCGIVGVLGRHEAAPLIVEALKRLEYRGYDSAGIATISEGRLARRRSVGKLVALSDLLVRDPIRGTSGIGHTRWATHGQPSEVNAHPHRAGAVSSGPSSKQAAAASRPRPTPRRSRSSATANSLPGMTRSPRRAPPWNASRARSPSASSSTARTT